VPGVRCWSEALGRMVRSEKKWYDNYLPAANIQYMAKQRSKVTCYRDLIVWQRAIELTDLVHKTTRAFPRDERFELTNQIGRAATSIPSNIAEGHGRTHLREYLNHLSIARGSLMELETQLTIAARRQYLTIENQQRLFDLSGEVGRLLAGLVRALRRRLPAPKT